MSEFNLFRLCWSVNLILTVVVAAFSQAPTPAVDQRPLRSFPVQLAFDPRAGKLVLTDYETRRQTDSVTRRQPFRNGALRLVSQATGISQMIESGGATVRFGQFTSNGQRLFSNIFEINGVPVNLGLLADDATIAAGLGGLPVLTASGGTQPSLQTANGATATVQTMESARLQRTGGATISSSIRGGTSVFTVRSSETLATSVSMRMIRLRKWPDSVARRRDQIRSAVSSAVRWSMIAVGF